MSFRLSIEQNFVEAEYADTGCELSPSCLSCPLPVCKEDDHLVSVRLRTAALDQRVYDAWLLQLVADRPQGKAVTTVAKEIGVTERTIFRSLKRHHKVAQ